MNKLLNDKDRDILFLIFVSRKKQKSVQKILRRSQPSLCYDIKRIKDRIEFILYLEKVEDIFFEFLLEKSSLYEPELIDILVLMFNTSSYTYTSKILKKKQISIRYEYEKVLRKMAELKHWNVYEIFSVIKRNKNKIKRTYESN